jgi:hypothetical protein
MTAAPSYAANASKTACQLGGSIKHIVHLQFDNVHLSRDNPNVPSDLEQMPNLLNFIKGEGTLLTNHHTPLISHTSVDILTTLTGVYGDKFGVPIGNSLRYFNPDGTSIGMGSFAYWTDPLNSFAAMPTDTTPQMIDQAGKTHPAPWAAFTRAGCDVGAFSTANIELENITSDIVTVFGNPSAEFTEAKNFPDKAMADFMGIAIHCAKGSALCAGGQDDLLPQEPGGYVGFNALFGNAFVQPAGAPSGPVKDLDGNVITDGVPAPNGPNVGFPGFDPSASQALGYVATMLEAGVPVVYLYIADAHDDHVNGVAFGPGQEGYVLQLQAYDRAFGQFFARLKGDRITPDNTLFIITSDENDHFVGGEPSPLGCDGVVVPCTYSQIGEIDANLNRLLNTPPLADTTPFVVHADSAPAFYVTGNLGQTDPIVRQLEQDVFNLTVVNPITHQVDPLAAAMADHTEQAFLHMITDDPARTPTFIMFGDPNYFSFSSGSTTSCNTAPKNCVVEQPGFAWNHGDFQDDITHTWLGMVGPGIRQLGETGAIFSDHTDIRPTMLTLVGLTDDYAHDGRALFEIIQNGSLPASLRSAPQPVLSQLADAYKQINAPLGQLGRETLELSTQALGGNSATYNAIELQISNVTACRNTIAGQMIMMLENATFSNMPIDAAKAKTLIDQANTLRTNVNC